jgi:hypothetical protein
MGRIKGRVRLQRGGCSVPRCEFPESKSQDSRWGLGVLKGGLEVLLVGFALPHLLYALDSRLRGNDTRRAGTGACPYGMWGQLPAHGSCDLCASWASVASPVPPTRVCRGAKPFCLDPEIVLQPQTEGASRGYKGLLPAGVWGCPPTSFLSPKSGGQGVKYDSLNAM